MFVGDQVPAFQCDGVCASWTCVPRSTQPPRTASNTPSIGAVCFSDWRFAFTMLHRRSQQSKRGVVSQTQQKESPSLKSMIASASSCMYGYTYER